MWLRRPEYRATPQSVFAKVQESARPRVVGRSRSCATGGPPTCLARHAKYPRRPRRVALWGVSRRSGSWRRQPTFYKMWAGANHVYVKERPEVSRGCAKHLRNGRGASFPAIGVSILPEKKRRGAGTDGTDTACGGHRWHRSCPSVRGGPSIGVHLCRRSRSRHSLPHFKMRFQCVINPIANQAP